MYYIQQPKDDLNVCTVKPVYKDRPREMLKTVFRRGQSLYEGFV